MLHVSCPHCHKTNRLPNDKLVLAPHCGACHQALFTGKPIELDDAGLQSQLHNSDLPLLVDFWAPWCGPCRSMAPAFVQATKRLEPQVRLAKLNTEIHQQSGAMFAIRSIPTMILFSAGKEVTRVSGAMSTEQIITWVRKASLT